MVEETKQHALWATTAIIIIIALLLQVTSCVTTQNAKAEAFAAKCVAAGKTYVPDSDDVLGSCV